MSLSVAIITYNEEKKIEKTLKALKDIADEIIIVDSFSEDKTKEIALLYGAKFYEEAWQGFGKQKNLALEKCSGDWTLLLDADEVLSDELRKKIVEIINTENKDVAYKLNRCSVCFGKEIKYGGWSNDYVIRLFRKGDARLDGAFIHEKMLTEKKVEKLSEKLYHYTYLNVEEYFSKFNSYTTKGALKRYEKGKRSSIIGIMFNPMYKFFKMYILKLGFLDGFDGFVLAMLSYMYNFVIQLKLYILKIEEK